MAWMTLEITDGTTTINLTDDINYNLVSWSPAIAQKQTGVLGGRSSYADVTEEIVIDMFGSSILDNFLELTAMLDKVGRSNEVVTVRVHAQGSTLASPQEARITEIAPGDGVILPVSTFELLHVDEVANVVIRFTRSGLWLGGIDSATTTGTGNPSVLSVTMTEELDIPGPTKLKFTGLSSSPVRTYGGWVLTDNGSTDFQIVQCETMTGDGSQQVDPDGYTAVGGYTRRFQASSGSYTIEEDVNITGVETLQIFIVARNDTQPGPKGWTMRVWSEAEVLTGYPNVRYSRYYSMDYLFPGVYNMGLLHHPLGQHDTIGIDIVSNQYADTSIYAYLDYMVIVPVTDNNASGQLLPGGQASGSSKLVFDHRALTHDRPYAFIESVSTGLPVQTLSSKSSVFIETTGQTIKACLMMPDLPDYYKVGDNVGMEVERYKAYLIPQ